MEPVTLYIADINARFISQVRSAIARVPSIRVLGSSSDGISALEDIRRMSPNVVLTDIPLPGLDGIGLLREIGRLRQAPSVIICTRFCSDAIMDCTCRLGASFFLCKPVDPGRLPALILDCRRCRCEPDRALPDEGEARPDQAGFASNLRALLKSLGMPSRLRGYAYAVEAVLSCRGDTQLLKNLSDGVYARLASRMGATVPSVERSLRSAIAVAYERGALHDRFPQRPTNRQFIQFLIREADNARDIALSGGLSSGQFD